MRRTGLVPVVAAVLVATALSGCARVPDGGPAVPVAIPEASQSTDPAIGSVNAQLPEPSSDAETSVSAYINALVTTRNPGPLGDRYLATPALRNTFSQDPSMAVVRGGIQKTVAEATADVTTATFRADLIGTVDSNGVFTRTDNPNWQVQVRLQKVKGVWLFAEPPPLIVQEGQQFTESFSSRTVYFAARPSAVTGPNPRLVIPERRYVNEDIGGLATQVVDFVLGGPAETMSSVAENPLQGIKRTSRVAVENGDLVIELEPQAEALNKEALNAFVAAVGWSLKGGAFYGAVRLLVGGRAMDVEGFAAVQDERSWRRYNPAAVMTNRPAFQVQNGGVKVLSSPGVVPKPERLATPTLAKGVRSAAVSIDLRRFAAVRADPEGGDRLWIADSSGFMQPTLRAPQIGRPTWGGHRSTVVVPIGGRLFEVGVGNARAPSEIQVVGPGGRALRDVTSVRLSLDGVRALLVAGRGATARVYVGTLNGSTPESLVLTARPLTVAGTPVDVSWWGPVTAVVAVAVQEQGARVALVFAPVDGSLTEQHRGLPDPGGVVRVAGDPAENTEASVLLEIAGKRHVEREDGENSGVPVAAATAPFYPG